MARPLLSGHLEGTILDTLLQKGSMSTTKIQDELFPTHQFTRQGFYRALRKLRSDERVVVYKSHVSVNEMWLRRVKHLINRVPGQSFIIGDFSKLGNGEQLSLTLKGLSAMDRLWSHLFSVIEEHVPSRHPLFLFNPHNWSAILREDADRAHESVLKQRKRATYLVIGSASALDNEATKNIGFQHVEFSFNPKHAQEVYVAVIGEYVIEVRLSPKTRKAVNDIFNKDCNLKQAKLMLQKIDRDAVCKIIIEKDASKAQQWTRRLSKEFYIPKKNRA